MRFIVVSEKSTRSGRIKPNGRGARAEFKHSGA